jgi:uridine kinase
MKIIVSINELLDEVINIKNNLDKKKMLFVSVAGLSRSGKSTLIAEIQQLLNEQSMISQVIELDHWILPNEKRNLTMTVKDRYQYDQISKDISILFDKGEIDIFPYEPLTRSTSKKKIQISIKDTQVIFFDGVIALDQPYINSISALKIFIDINEEIRKTRFINFYKTKKLADIDIQILYEKRMQDEVEFVRQSRNKADLIINSGII